eukprot:7505582-Pyramimonas_sp.AAC.1
MWRNFLAAEGLRPWGTFIASPGASDRNRNHNLARDKMTTDRPGDKECVVVYPAMREQRGAVISSNAHASGMRTV